MKTVLTIARDAVGFVLLLGICLGMIAVMAAEVEAQYNPYQQVQRQNQLHQQQQMLQQQRNQASTLRQMQLDQQWQALQQQGLLQEQNRQLRRQNRTLKQIDNGPRCVIWEGNLVCR